MQSEPISFPLDASKYEMLSKIGCGATSEVHVAKCLTNNQIVAIKLINLELYPMEIEFLRQEVAFWSNSQHPQVVQYYGSFINGPMLYILMEYMAGGSVSDIIRYSFPNGFKDESVIATILLAILQALDYIHSNNELHRDVKPGNALISSEGKVKIGDFGVAATLFEGGQRRRARYTVIGTPCYMAPEILQEETGYTQKADIWSFGITAIELATGSAPYSTLQPLAVVQKILKAPPPNLFPSNGHSVELCNLVKACLNHDPTKRPTAQDLLQMPFFKKAQPDSYIKDVVISKLPPLDKRFSTIYSDNNSPSVDQFMKVSHTDWNFELDGKGNDENNKSQDDSLITITTSNDKLLNESNKKDADLITINKDPQPQEGVQKGRFKVVKESTNTSQTIPQSMSLPPNVSNGSSQPASDNSNLEAVVATLSEKVNKLTEENKQIRAEIRSLLEIVHSLNKK